MHEFRALLIENTDVHRASMEIDPTIVFMVLWGEIHPGVLLEVECGGTAILLLHLAAEEAWMSINSFHRIAARLRFCIS